MEYAVHYIAHVRQSDKKCQDVCEHLLEVSKLCGDFAAKIGLYYAGVLIGLLHDLGKYSKAFQEYIKLAAGIYLEVEARDIFSKAVPRRGDVDHATAGAQWVWQNMALPAKGSPYYVQWLALAICSHHSGLIDCLRPDGSNRYLERMNKDGALTHLDECLRAADEEVISAMQDLTDNSHSGRLMAEELRVMSASIREKAVSLAKSAHNDNAKYHLQNFTPFRLGLTARFLLSCLLDADRINSTEFEDDDYKKMRRSIKPVDWGQLLKRFEDKLAQYAKAHWLDKLRGDISDHCARRGTDGRGLFTLTVPTGGGKTLSSLRFALTHAKEHQLDRIIYVIPYTSIIEQNAAKAREILEGEKELGSVVLEHHSNLLADVESRQARFLTSNWESPVVFTTMVQFLNALFASGTGNARRMHALARTVLIFDEIQCIPVNCVHLFCNALNFLVDHCGSSAVLCTATQPLLGDLPEPFKGQLALPASAEIMPDAPTLFQQLRRVRFINHCRSPMQEKEIAALAMKEVGTVHTCLIVTNTKGWAKKLYNQFSKNDEMHVFYLSTNLCSAHRTKVFETIHHLFEENKKGKKHKILCISTQLIECGVDISFGSVIRFAAGLDSILQAAGRCNRNAEARIGNVHIVRVPEGQEKLAFLPEIQEGRRAFLRLMDEVLASGDDALDLTGPDFVRRYFNYYFNSQKHRMDYPTGRGHSLLRILGENDKNPGHNERTRMLQQSFADASSRFQPIDAPTQGIIVPYEDGKRIIGELASDSGLYGKRELLHKAQRYSVNVYSNAFAQLKNCGALYPLGETGAVALKQEWYDERLGVVTDPSGKAELHIYG